MCNKQQPLKWILVGAAMSVFPGTAAWAYSVSVPSDLSVNPRSEVRMVDGGVPDSMAIIMAGLDKPARAPFDSGFMNQGMPDDQTDRLSDSAGNFHARKEVTQSEDRDFPLTWDGDRDGKRSAPNWFEGKSGKHVCPAPTTVPLPGTLLFFGSGLLGMAATLRRGQRA